VTCIDQNLKRPLINPKLPNSKAQIQIVAEEVKASSNSEMVIFNPVAQLSDGSGFYFFIVYKIIALG